MAHELELAECAAQRERRARAEAEARALDVRRRESSLESQLDSARRASSQPSLTEAEGLRVLTRELAATEAQLVSAWASSLPAEDSAAAPAARRRSLPTSSRAAPPSAPPRPSSLTPPLVSGGGSRLASSLTPPLVSGGGSRHASPDGFGTVRRKSPTCRRLQAEAGAAEAARREAACNQVLPRCIPRHPNRSQ